MSKTIQIERKDTNLANKLESNKKIPIEYTRFRDAILDSLSKMEETHCGMYVPQLYNILTQAGLSPHEARAIVLKDGTELFKWSTITILKYVPAEAKNHVKAKAGKISADRVKQKKLVDSAVREASTRGPGRPRKIIEPTWNKVIVDCMEFTAQFAQVADLAAKAGTNKAMIEISSEGKLNISAYLVGAKTVTN